MYKIMINNTLFCDSNVDELAVSDPVVELEVNKAGTFTMSVPPTHPIVVDYSLNKTTASVYIDNDSNPVFVGVLKEKKEDLNKFKNLMFEGELTYLNDSVLRPARKTGETVTTLLQSYINEHNEQVDESKQFTIGRITVNDTNNYISCYTNYNNTLSEINADLVEDLGGYLIVRKENGVRYLDYLAEPLNTCTQEIRLGENLLTYESNKNVEDIYTAIIPLGATLEEQEIEGLDAYTTIKSVNNGKDYLVNENEVSRLGFVCAVVKWDNVTDPSILKTKGSKYLNSTQYDNMTIECEAADLHYNDENVEMFKLFDKVHVVSKEHGLDKYFPVTKIEYNLNNPESNKIKLGIDKQESLTATQISENEIVKKEIESIKPSKILENAKINSSNLINTATNGFITFVNDADGNPKELIISDTKDYKQSTRLWKWNVNGLGYTNEGNNGLMQIAMTMDGQIVADFIKTGTMYADRIKGGTLNLGGLNNVNGILQIKNANGEVIGSWDKNGISATNCDLSGRMKSGESSSYLMELYQGKIIGYYNGIKRAQIDVTSQHTVNGTTYNGMQIDTNLLRLNNMANFLIDSESICVINNRASNSFYEGCTGKISYVTSLNFETMEKVASNLRFTSVTDNYYVSAYLQSCTWHEEDLTYAIGVNKKTLSFDKGLMTTSLS